MGVLPFLPSFGNPLFVPAAGLLILFLIYGLYKYLFTASSQNRRTILLLGTLESGKTAILSSLIYNQTPQTHTSLQTNASILPIPIQDPNTSTKPKRVTPYTLVDIPGHPRLRTGYASHLPSTNTILFVVDTGTIARSTSPGAANLVAEYLHQILYQVSLLSEEAARRGSKAASPKIVILAHKVDLVNTAGALSTGSGGKSPATKGEIGLTRVRTILERELTRRANDLKHSVGIEGLGSDESVSSRSKTHLEADAGLVIDTSSGHTGLECTNSPGDGFKFDAWEYGEIEFVSTWVRVNEGKYDYEGGDEKEEDTSRERREREQPGGDGLADLKDWLNGNLS